MENELDIRKALWTCDANFGRSPMAHAVFHKLYPNIPSDSAAMWFDDRRMVIGKVGAHSDVRRIMKEFGYDLGRHLAKPVKSSMVDDQTDLFILGDVIAACIKHRKKIVNARSAVALTLDDPSDLNLGGTLADRIIQTYKRIDEIVKDLPRIMRGVRKGDFSVVHGITYPFGLPEQATVALIDRLMERGLSD